MNISSVLLSRFIAFLLMLSPLFASSSFGCSCFPDENRNLCQLGDEANSGQRSNFLAVVELIDSTMAGDVATYSVRVEDLLAGVLPAGDIFLVQFNGASCSQYDIIDLGVRGVLSGQISSGMAYPTFCSLSESFFRMNMDTVFVPLYDNGIGSYDEPYTLADFRAGNCAEVVNLVDLRPAEEAFTIEYFWAAQQLEVISLDPSARSANLTLSIYSSNGQHLLEAQPSSPIDMSSFPPGMYAILIRNEQHAWSKAFVKPN